MTSRCERSYMTFLNLKYLILSSFCCLFGQKRHPQGVAWPTMTMSAPTPRTYLNMVLTLIGGNSIGNGSPEAASVLGTFPPSATVPPFLGWQWQPGQGCCEGVLPPAPPDQDNNGQPGRRGGAAEVCRAPLEAGQPKEGCATFSHRCTPLLGLAPSAPLL
jgi:hypothetical protein